MLNKTKVVPERISVADMFLFFEKVIRGRLSHIFNRFGKTNNKYVKSYDLTQESKTYFIIRRKPYTWLFYV